MRKQSTEEIRGLVLRGGLPDCWVEVVVDLCNDIDRQQTHIALLTELGNRQRDEIETLNGFADAVETLREIGKLIGCGHVDSPDERRQLVNCVEQSLFETAR